MAEPEFSQHHLWFPACAYRNGFAKKFRELPCQKIYLPHSVHKLIHRFQKPPNKPSAEAMLAAIVEHERGDCGCKR